MVTLNAEGGFSSELQPTFFTPVKNDPIADTVTEPSLNPDWLIGQPLRMWMGARGDMFLVGPLLTEPVVAIALSYGARAEITQAVRDIAAKVAAGELSADLITEELIEENLSTAGIPDPDLLIRTSGEQRISNFLLWQSAYTEFVFEDVLWPDFDRSHLEKAIDNFAGRERRFGAVI